MQIIVDEIDNLYYAEIILTREELKKLNQFEMLSAQVIHKRRKCYVGIRQQGCWDHEEEPTK